MKYKVVNNVWTPQKPQGYLIASIILLILTSAIFALVVDNLARPAEYNHCMQVELNKNLCKNI